MYRYLLFTLVLILALGSLVAIWPSADPTEADISAKIPSVDEVKPAQVSFDELPATRPSFFSNVNSINGTAAQVPRNINEPTPLLEDLIKRKAAHLAEIEAETLEASIRQLRQEPVSELFQEPAYLIDLSSVPSIQASLMDDPRVSKVLSNAMSESDETRANVLHLVLQELDSYLVDLEHRAYGTNDLIQELNLNSGLAFPIILAAADDSGKSLSSLIDWYHLDKLVATNSTVELQAAGYLPPDLPDPENARTETMPIIASAILVILDKLGAAPETLVLTYFPDESELMHRDTVPSPALSDLVFPDVSPAHSDELVEAARIYLGEKVP